MSLLNLITPAYMKSGYVKQQSDLRRSADPTGAFAESFDSRYLSTPEEMYQATLSNEKRKLLNGEARRQAQLEYPDMSTDEIAMLRTRNILTNSQPYLTKVQQYQNYNSGQDNTSAPALTITGDDRVSTNVGMLSGDDRVANSVNTVSGDDLSLDEIMYDPSQPNKLYTFEDGKRMVEKLGLINRTDAEIQQAVDTLNSRITQQTPAPTTPALDPTTATADPNAGALTTVGPNTAVADPVSQPILNTQGTAQNEQRLQAMFDSMNAEKEGKQGLTGNARESTSTFHKLAMTGMGEKLMRMGAAMNANAHLGGNVMLGAMGQQAAAFNAERLAAEQFQQEQRANSLSAYNESIAEQQASLDVVEDSLRSYQSALEQFDKFEGATGYVGGTVNKFIDNLPFGNAERQAFRLQLQSIAVDETLLRTAQTKGAISDREMALFRSPVPSLYAREDVWKAWLKARIENMNVIRDRIARGITVSRDAGIGFTNTYSYADDQDAQNYALEQENQTGQNMSPAPQAQQTKSLFSDDELKTIESNL